MNLDSVIEELKERARSAGTSDRRSGKFGWTYGGLKQKHHEMNS